MSNWEKINFQKISQNIFNVLCCCALLLPSASPRRQTVQPHWSIRGAEPRFWTQKCSWKIWTKVQCEYLMIRIRGQGLSCYIRTKSYQWGGTNFVIGFGKQVHFSQRISRVIRNITKPEARNTRNRDSVLKVNSKVIFVCLCKTFKKYSLRNCYKLYDVQADVDKYRTSKVRLQHFVPLLAVSFLNEFITN